MKAISTPCSPVSLAPEGQHFTPTSLARWLVTLTVRGDALVGVPPWRVQGGGEGDCLRVVDPACGDGSLLGAALEVLSVERAAGAVGCLGVEVDPLVAGRARQRFEAEVWRGASAGDEGLSRAPVRDRSRAGEAPSRVVTGDALALAAAGHGGLRDGEADLVLLNPPYLGEKGHRALFEQVVGLGDRWAARHRPRMDYLYFFLHLGLDLLRPGGRMMALTTAYWPSATSASALRVDLGRRARVLAWVRFGGAPIFAGARGQQNLALIVERVEAPQVERDVGVWVGARVSRARSGEVSLAVSEVCEGVALSRDGSPWQPFQGEEERRAASRAATWPTRLGDLVKDRQGVVSGLDRVARRHQRWLGEVPQGRPGYVLTGPEVAARGWDRDPEVRPWLEPLLRGSSIGRLDERHVRGSLTAPEARVMLYMATGRGGPPEALLRHLAPLRPVLERRREVREGVRPWWALHWPRRLDWMRRPKLVTARRGATCRFCLDHGGHVVSSDCTWMVMEGDDLEALRVVWRALHEEPVEAVMKATGKFKGGLMEFYSEPLRRWPMPLVWRAGVLCPWSGQGGA